MLKMELKRFLTKKSREPRQFDKADEEEIARNLTSRFSEGNVSLFFGNYLSEEDINKRRKQVLEHNFLNQSKS